MLYIGRVRSKKKRGGGREEGGRGGTWFRWSKNAQQENKGTSTSEEQKQQQHLPIRHAGRPADLWMFLWVGSRVFQNMVSLAGGGWKKHKQGSGLENNGGMCPITSSTAQEKKIVHPTSSSPWCWQPWGGTVGNHVSCTALPMGKRNSGAIIYGDRQEETKHWKQIDKKNDKQ